jgi:hypothetical protein
MDKDLPVYEIRIDLENEETGLEANSGVHDPAHELFITFKGQKKVIKLSDETIQKQMVENFNTSMQFNDDTQTIYGVAISADQPIYRNDGEEEFYVAFTKEGIADMIHDYSRKGNFNNFNIEHDSGNNESGVYMIMSYQINEDKDFNAPAKFKDANDGSWILGYKVTNSEVYNKFKTGEIRGFSIEGTFVLDTFGFSKDIESQLDELIEILENKQG